MSLSLVRVLESIGAQPADEVELRTQKRVLVMLSALIAFLAIFWSALYLAFDEPLAATIPFTYTLAVAVSLAAFAKTRRYRAFRFSQLSLILLLPFFLQLALGGFINGSIVILWSLLAPVGALGISGRAHAIRWMVAYATLVVIAQIVQPILGNNNNNLSQEIIKAFFVMNLVGPSAVAFFAMHYFVGQKDEVLEQLDIESEKSERLLLNVLPREIAAELKETGKTTAQYFPEVTVLFADIVGFTTLSEEMGPGDMVILLNGAFSYFDSLSEKYGLEKIRTMGDSYMVAAGVPVKRSDHAAAMAQMALEMLAFQVPNNRLRFRIGMSSGPAVAGVIGTAKFQYDVWGDTVNTASRMESHGIPGKIQISPTSHSLLGNEFVFEERGPVDVKGKGVMQTWFLTGAR